MVAKGFSSVAHAVLTASFHAVLHHQTDHAYGTLLADTMHLMKKKEQW